MRIMKEGRREAARAEVKENQSVHDREGERERETERGESEREEERVRGKESERDRERRMESYYEAGDVYQDRSYERIITC